MRKSGILLPITSLGSEYGIGCFSKEAYDFIDFLYNNGQSLWQILPLGHTGFGDSPYQSFSAFAGNPYMIDLNTLIDEGLITRQECQKALPKENTGRINYSDQYQKRYPLLRKAYARSNFNMDAHYRTFYSQNEYWLGDYSLFMALKEHFGGCMWTKWPEDIKQGKNKEKYQEALKTEVGFWNFVQFKFYRQWNKLKSYANKKGIEIIGDIPIYVAMDSCDVWANPHLFELDGNLNPLFVAGCPPDGFSAKGQLWGNPIYKWQNHKKDGFAWWTQRIKHSLTLYDMLRIDHFRGFESFYSIPYGSIDATVGTWEKAPGRELFDTIKSHVPDAGIIAEDLGFITDDVKKLLRHTGFAGIKVLEFAFDKRDSGMSEDYLPHNYPINSVAYTGTHDNEPISAWFDALEEKSALKVRKYLCNMHTPNDEMHKSLISEVMKSPADTVIIPIWDVLGMGNEARINTPGTQAGNWTWRIKDSVLNNNSETFLSEMSELYGRNAKNL